jgi:hypothetical protein
MNRELSNAVVKRQKVEKAICTKVVDVLLAAGYSLGVNDGDDITIHHSTDRKAILKALFTTDEDYLYIYEQDSNVEDIRWPDYWVRFVYGNDGWDVISDYCGATALDPYLGDGTEVQKLVDKYAD